MGDRRGTGAGCPRGAIQAVVAYFSPLTEFLKREGALIVLVFVMIHKIGDTLANLTLRLLFQDLGFTNDEIAFYESASASLRCWWAYSSAGFCMRGSG